MLLELALLAQAVVATPAPPTRPPTAAPRLSGGFGAKPGSTAAQLKAPVVLAVGGRSSRAGSGTFNVAGVAGSEAPVPMPIPGAAGPPPVALTDEAAWRGRATKLRADLADAQGKLAVADAANTVVAHGKLGQDYYVLMAIRDNALAPHRARVAEITRELDGLPEECRKTAGCQPGWVR